MMNWTAIAHRTRPISRVRIRIPVWPSRRSTIDAAAKTRYVITAVSTIEAYTVTVAATDFAPRASTITVEIAPGPASIGTPSGMMPISSFWIPSAVSTGVSRWRLRRAWTMSRAFRPMSTPPAILNAPIVMPKILKIMLPPRANAMSVFVQVHAPRRANAPVRPRQESDRHGLAVADDVDRDRRARTDGAYRCGHVGAVDDGPAVDPHQLIPRAQTRRLRRAPRRRDRAPAAALDGGRDRADARVHVRYLGERHAPPRRAQIVIPGDFGRAAHV